MGSCSQFYKRVNEGSTAQTQEHWLFCVCVLAVSLVGVGGGGRRRCPEKVPEIFMFITPGTHTNLEKGLKTFYGAKAIGILLLGMSLTAEKMLSLQ